MKFNIALLFRVADEAVPIEDVARTLSRSVMETLAIIAYKQPITRSEIEQIKGVSADYSVNVLLQRGLIMAVGRKNVLGRPMLYGSTDDFLRHFGIASLDQMPPLLSETVPMDELTMMEAEDD